MSERLPGRITLVWTEELGTALTQDEAAGTRTLHVDDVSPFNDDNELDADGNLGYLLIGSQTVGYTAVDDDASTITIAEDLAAGAEEDDDVLAWNDLYGRVDDQQWAWVDPDGGDRQDPIKARVKESIELDDGDRGGRGESCTIRRRSGSDGWLLSGVHGRPSTARGIRFEHAEPAYSPTDDELTAGTFSHQLLHTNIAPQSGLFTTINGVALGADSWSLDAAAGVATVTIPDWVADAPSGRREFGWPMYAYRRGIAVDPPEVDPVTPTWVVPQAITDYYDADAVYHSTGPLTGQSFVEAQPTGSWGNHGRYNFSWTLPADFGTFAELGIVAIKFVGEFDGDGEVFFAINANDPGWPGTPEWTDDSGYSHLTLNPTDSFVVSGPTSHEWILALTDTASDDLYQGLSYNNPLQDFEISLHATVAEGYDANYCDGTLQGASAGTVDLLRFDMVLIGTPS